MNTIFTRPSLKLFVSLTLLFSFLYKLGYSASNIKRPDRFSRGAPLCHMITDTSKTKWVSWKSKDSIKVDSMNDIIYLYGDAELKSDDMNIKADYIKYDRRNNECVGIGSVTAKIKSKDISIYGDKIVF